MKEMVRSGSNWGWTARRNNEGDYPQTARKARYDDLKEDFIARISNTCVERKTFIMSWKISYVNFEDLNIEQLGKIKDT